MDLWIHLFLDDAAVINKYWDHKSGWTKSSHLGSDHTVLFWASTENLPLSMCRFCCTVRLTHMTKDAYYSSNYNGDDDDDNDNDNNNNNNNNNNGGKTSGLSEPSEHYVWLQSSYLRRAVANSWKNIWRIKINFSPSRLLHSSTQLLASFLVGSTSQNCHRYLLFFWPVLLILHPSLEL